MGPGDRGEREQGQYIPGEVSEPEAKALGTHRGLPPYPTPASSLRLGSQVARESRSAPRIRLARRRNHESLREDLHGQSEERCQVQGRESLKFKASCRMERREMGIPTQKGLCIR